MASTETEKPGCEQKGEEEGAPPPKPAARAGAGQDSYDECLGAGQRCQSPSITHLPCPQGQLSLTEIPQPHTMASQPSSPTPSQSIFNMPKILSAVLFESRSDPGLSLSLPAATCTATPAWALKFVPCPGLFKRKQCHPSTSTFAWSRALIYEAPWAFPGDQNPLGRQGSYTASRRPSRKHVEPITPWSRTSQNMSVPPLSGA